MQWRSKVYPHVLLTYTVRLPCTGGNKYIVYRFAAEKCHSGAREASASPRQALYLHQQLISKSFVCLMSISNHVGKKQQVENKLSCWAYFMCMILMFVTYEQLNLITSRQLLEILKLIGTLNYVEHLGQKKFITKQVYILG